MKFFLFRWHIPYKAYKRKTFQFRKKKMKFSGPTNVKGKTGNILFINSRFLGLHTTTLILCSHYIADDDDDDDDVVAGATYTNIYKYNAKGILQHLRKRKKKKKKRKFTSG